MCARLLTAVYIAEYFAITRDLALAFFKIRRYLYIVKARLLTFISSFAVPSNLVLATINAEGLYRYIGYIISSANHHLGSIVQTILVWTLNKHDNFKNK